MRIPLHSKVLSNTVLPLNPLGKHKKAQMNIHLSFFYVQDERYVAVPWMAKSDDVQAFLRHPVFQGISASVHVDNGMTLLHVCEQVLMFRLK